MLNYFRDNKIKKKGDKKEKDGVVVNDLPSYPDSDVKPAEVSDPSWDSPHRYTPVDYTAPEILDEPEWADPDITKGKHRIAFNVIDKGVDRTSYTGVFDTHKGLPRNPIGRTGIRGRGKLGRWGPNHETVIVFTRLMRKNGAPVLDEGKPIFQFLAIKPNATDRSDHLTFVAGMVPAGELIPPALKAVFTEENITQLDSMSLSAKTQKINELYSNPTVLTEGILDDPRNTDNAWVEAKTIHIHDATGATEPFALTIDNVVWTTVYQGLNLPPAHLDMIKKVAAELNAAMPLTKPEEVAVVKATVVQVTAKVLYDYSAIGPTQLDIKAGQQLLILERAESWWLARNEQGQQGYVPSNFLSDDPLDMEEDDDEDDVEFVETGEGWDCPVCQNHNDDEETSCTVCETLREKSVALGFKGSLGTVRRKKNAQEIAAEAKRRHDKMQE